MKLRMYFYLNYLHLLSLILCCIPINESYYNNISSNNVLKNIKNDYGKFLTIKKEHEERISKSSPHSLEQQTYFDSYDKSPYQYQTHQPKSGKPSPYSFSHDLFGPETNSMDVSNTLWNSNGFNYKNNGDWKNRKKGSGVEDFKKNGHKLVDDWIYSPDDDEHVE